MRKILFGLLDPFVAGRRVERALEAGCGTGYFARVCQERYGWPVYPVDLGWEGLRYGHENGTGAAGAGGLADAAVSGGELRWRCRST